MTRYIDFVPPIIGLDGTFNTFRLGLFFAKRLTVGESVLLTNSKERLVIGNATVIGVHTGRLVELALNHAHMNHAMMEEVPAFAPQVLMALLRKIYGPHLATDNRSATVVYLRRDE